MMFTTSVDVLATDKHNGLATLNTYLVGETELFGAWIEVVSHGMASYSLSKGPCYCLDHCGMYLTILIVKDRVEVVLRLQVFGYIFIIALDVIEPAEPALVMFVALVHHRYIFISFVVNYVKFREKAASSKPFYVFHASLHKLGQVESRRVVVVVAEDGLVGSLDSTRRVSKACLEVIKPCHWFIAYTVLRVDSSYLLSYDVVGFLQPQLLTQSRYHHQRVGKLISWPWLVGNLVGNYLGVVSKGLGYLLPVPDESVSHAMLVGPQCFKASSYRF